MSLTAAALKKFGIDPIPFSLQYCELYEYESIIYCSGSK